jgi:hypothetical protein
MGPTVDFRSCSPASLVFIDTVLCIRPASQEIDFEGEILLCPFEDKIIGRSQSPSLQFVLRLGKVTKGDDREISFFHPAHSARDPKVFRKDLEEET